MGLFDGIREWQFRRADENFWRQATPALREHLNPQARAGREERNQRLAREHAANGERETAFVCSGLARADSPAERARVYRDYTDMVQRNVRNLGRKYGVALELPKGVTPLRDIAPVCARRAGVSTRGR